MPPIAALGVAMACLWTPLTATATRNLPAHLAGAGSGVFIAARQLGMVLGSAGIAAFIPWRIAAEMPSIGGSPGLRTATTGKGAALHVPESLREPLALAMSQAMLLPAAIAVVGIVVMQFLGGSVTPTITSERT